MTLEGPFTLQQAQEFETVVVGAGLLGLATARALARRGRGAVVLEQAEVGHDRSGSKGAARIFRTSYDDPQYGELARSARSGWADLAAETGRRLFVRTGLLSFGGDLRSLAEVVAGDGVAADDVVFDEQDLRHRFPGLEPPGPAVFEQDAGILLADGALLALAESAAATLTSATVLSGRRVVEVDDDGRRVRIRCADGYELSTPCAVLCAGAFTAELLGSGGYASALTALAAALSPSLQQVAYLRPTSSTPGDVREAPSLPAFVDRAGSHSPYGLPEPVATGPVRYKVGLHQAGERVDPRAVELERDDAAVERCLEVMQQLWPRWEWEVVGADRCLYDNTPDEDFVIDRVGNVVVGTGTSGHGFKFGPALGELLADLVEEGEIAEPWRGRFFSGRSGLAIGAG